MEEELTMKEIRRQDYVDMSIFELICQVNPTDTELNWDINIVAHVREAIQHCLVEKLGIVDDYSFYPYLRENIEC